MPYYWIELKSKKNPNQREGIMTQEIDKKRAHEVLNDMAENFGHRIDEDDEIIYVVKQVTKEEYLKHF